MTNGRGGSSPPAPTRSVQAQGSSLLSHVARFRLSVIAATAVAFLLRWLDLDRHGFWLDELFTVRAASRETWLGMLEELARDVHPPGYYALIRGLIGVVEPTEITLRLPSVLAGTLCVPAAAWLAHQLYGKEAGTVGAWLVATAPFLVLLDREARVNSLLDLVILGLLAATLSGIGRDLRWTRLAFLAAAAVQLHVFGYLAVATALLWVLIRRDEGLTLRLSALAVGVATAIPWWPTLFRQVEEFSADPWYLPPSWDTAGWLLWELSAQQAGIVGIIGIGLVLGLVRLTSPGHGLLAMAVLVFFAVPQLLSEAVAPVLRPRNVAVVVPLLCVVAGAGWRAVGPRSSGLALGSLAVVLCALSSHGRKLDPPHREDWREAAAVVAASWSHGDVLLANHAQLWRHYLPRAIYPTDLHGPVPDGVRRVWLLVGHDTPGAGLGKLGTLGETVFVAYHRHATVALAIRAWSPLPLDGHELPAPSSRDDAGLHLYWNATIRTRPLRLVGRCELGITGWGEAAAGVKPKLHAQVHAGEEMMAETWWDLGPSSARHTLPPLPAGLENTEVRLSISLINDDQAALPEGVTEDRNAHIEAILARCGP